MKERRRADRCSRTSVRGFLGRSALQKMLRSHFAGASLAELATASRTFPITARVDLQTAVDELLTRRDGARLVGC